MKKLLVVDVAALGWELASARAPAGGPFSFRPLETVFPALTCPVQASFRTARPPGQHGLVSNGLYFRDLAKVLFWEQSAALVGGPRIWDGFRARGGRVGMMFWQQSLGEAADLVLSPRPIHKHEGGMIQDCYSQPADLYERVCAKVGRSFNLMHYWGPLASRKSSEWIVDATCAVMADPALAPELLFTYLPHLDYDLQRHGPGSAAGDRAAAVLFDLLGRLHAAAAAAGYDVLVFGDYAIERVTGPAALPNLALRKAGLMKVRSIRGMAYPDFFTSEAFAMADHAVAHVYARDAEAALRAARTLRDLPGLAEICDRRRQEELGLGGPRSGDLVLLAAPGAWLAYPWWTDRREAPDFATHVDIHNKPGYDPCELFFGWPPLSVSLDTAKVQGTHGRAGAGARVAWACTRDIDPDPRTLLDLAAAVRAMLEK